DHPVAVVGLGPHRTGERADEAGPAGPALELVVGGEEGLTAAGAEEPPWALLPVQRAGEGALGPVLAEDGVSGGPEPLLPIVVGVLDLEVLVAHGDGLHAPGTHEAPPRFRGDGFRSVPAHPHQPPSRDSGGDHPQEGPDARNPWSAAPRRRSRAGR